MQWAGFDWEQNRDYNGFEAAPKEKDTQMCDAQHSERSETSAGLCERSERTLP